MTRFIAVQILVSLAAFANGAPVRAPVCDAPPAPTTSPIPDMGGTWLCWGNPLIVTQHGRMLTVEWPHMSILGHGHIHDDGSITFTWSDICEGDTNLQQGTFEAGANGTWAGAMVYLSAPDLTQMRYSLVRPAYWFDGDGEMVARDDSPP